MAMMVVATVTVATECRIRSSMLPTPPLARNLSRVYVYCREACLRRSTLREKIAA